MADRTAEWLQNTRIHQETAQIALEVKDTGNWCLAAVVNVDMPRAVAAVESVLKQADDWTEGSYSSSSALDEDRAWVRAACGARVREAIRAALAGTGKEGGDE